MQNNKRADTLAGIIVAVFILSFALLGIINVLDYNKDIGYNYDREIDKYILKSNAENIINKLDTSKLLSDENFYVFKDTITKEYKIMTGALNENYKYINSLGKNVDKDDNLGKNFTREYTKKIDILRHDLKPTEIPNLIYHFDANNIDGTNNSSYTVDGQQIISWQDLSGNNFDATNSTSDEKPTFNIDGINKLPMVKFDGINDLLKIPTNIMINNDGDNYAQRTFNEKSFAIVLKTGSDVTSTQLIYEQGGAATGYSFSVHNGKIYAGIHNKSDSGYANTDFSPTDSSYHFTRDNGNKFKSVELDEALPNTIYYIMIVQDSTHKDSGGNFVDNMNKIQIYLNAKLINESDHVDPQPEHSHIGLGAVNSDTVYSWNGDTRSCSECDFFKGGIGEFISWNHALSKNEVRGVQNYFLNKWLGGKQNIEYNVINTKIKEYNF